jgi:type I restriction enzyme S subunit
MDDEWQLARVGDLAEWRGGLTPSMSNPEFWDGGTVPWLSSKDIASSVIESASRAVTDEALRAGGLRKARAGSVVIVVRSGILLHTFPVAFVPFATTVNQDLKIGEPVEGVDGRFLAYLFESQAGAILGAFRKTGTTVQSINVPALMSYEVPLPPLLVQRRIVDLMAHLDNQVNLLRAEAEKLQALEKRSREALTSPQDGWIESSLRSVCTKIGSGSTPRGGEAAYKEDGISLIRSQNVHDGRFVWEGLAHIDDAQAAGLSNVTVAEGDCLTNITGASVNRTCVVPLEALPARVNQHVAILRANPDKTSGRFINQLLRRAGTRAYLDRVAQAGTTRQAITKQQLGDLNLTFPPLEEQTKIVETLISLERHAAALATEASALQVLRSQLLIVLLSGQVRMPASYDELLGVAS